MNKKRALLGILCIGVMAGVVFGAITWLFTSQTLIHVITITGLRAKVVGPTFSDYTSQTLATGLNGSAPANNLLAVRLTITQQNAITAGKNLKLAINITNNQDLGLLGVQAYLAWTAIGMEGANQRISYFDDATRVAMYQVETNDWWGSTTPVPTIFRNITSAVDTNNDGAESISIPYAEVSRIMYDSTLPNQTPLALTDCNAITIFFVINPDMNDQNIILGDHNLHVAIRLGVE